EAAGAVARDREHEPAHAGHERARAGAVAHAAPIRRALVWRGAEELREFARQHLLHHGLDELPERGRVGSDGWTPHHGRDGLLEQALGATVRGSSHNGHRTSPGQAGRQPRVVPWFTQKMDGGRFYFTASIPDLHISTHTTRIRGSSVSVLTSFQS